MFKIKGNSGFTLVELIVVLAVIGIGSTLAMFSIHRMLPDLRLKAAARDLQSDLNQARLRAIRENSYVSVRFDTGGNEYVVFIDDGAGGITDGDMVLNGSETALKTVAMPKGVTMYAASFSGGVPRTRFDGRGIPNGLGGHVYMRNTGNNYRGISMTTIGKVTIQSSSNGSTWTDI
ncbi:MAG: GspH/FimT family pseudopilin [Desulfobacterales bacterium]|nr:GspH/FimT family pseudopilin [Desulfobacterales bacterium]MDD4464224.1 GspH/FimT family pseudopilin [Desulfobacterales bacterium]